MKTKNKNPFYFLLILVGILFFVSATTYGVMAIRETNRPESSAEHPAVEHAGLMNFMDRYGDRLLIIEAILLGLLTVAAIGFDEIAGRSETKTPASKQSQKGSEI